MYRLAYREPLCHDCREDNPWPVCECGYMRPLSDEFSVVDIDARIEWTVAGAIPRLLFDAFQRVQIRDAILAYGVAHLTEIVVSIMLETFGWPGLWQAIE